MECLGFAPCLRSLILVIDSAYESSLTEVAVILFCETAEKSNICIVGGFHHGNLLVKLSDGIAVKFGLGVQIHDFIDIPEVDICLCHLDIAPRNILLTHGSNLYLLDWGCAGFYPSYFETWAIQFELHSSGHPGDQSVVCGSQGRRAFAPNLPRRFPTFVAVKLRTPDLL